jgi:hypothetical protein
MSHNTPLYNSVLLLSLFASLPAAAQQWGGQQQQNPWGAQPQQQQQRPQQQQQQGANLTGAWTAGQQGGHQMTVLFNPNGTYVNVEALPNGSMQRIEGVYRTTPLSPTSVRLDLQLRNWAPHQICAHVPGGQQRCSPYSPPKTASLEINFNSPSSFESQGAQFQRDPSPYLLQQQVPDMVDNTAQAPVAPNIQQPVMPTLHPYQTPGGPGSVGAMKYDDEHLQPQRVCGVTGGTVYTTQDGVQHCSTQ